MVYPVYGTQYPYTYAQGYQMNQRRPMEWVDGEIGACAFQKPAELNPGENIPLWDSNEKTIYLKSWNQMGMANPLQVLDYIREQVQPVLPQGQSSVSESMNYASKEDLERLKEEILSAINSRSMNGNGGGRNGKPAI